MDDTKFYPGDFVTVPARVVACDGETVTVSAHGVETTYPRASVTFVARPRGDDAKKPE